MPRRLRNIFGLRVRDALAVLMAFGHLLAATGLPSPAPQRAKSGAGIAYPCQSRPCGCFGSEQCWKGDCCCFTLEEKLTWAEANGVEPPPHVRPLVASRAAGPSKASPVCCAKPKPAPDAGIRWVVGMYAQKCRGESPTDLLQLESVALDADGAPRPPEAERSPFDRPRSETPSPTRATPPIPPPKHV